MRSQSSKPDCSNENEIANDTRPMKKRKQCKKYRIGPQIGVGAHGEVRCGYDYSCCEHIAIKIVETQRYDAGTQARIEKEIELLHRLNNEDNCQNHIMGMRDVFDKVAYIGTWCNGCGCTQFMQERGACSQKEQNDLDKLRESMQCHLQVPLSKARYSNDNKNSSNNAKTNDSNAAWAKGGRINFGNDGKNVAISQHSLKNNGKNRMNAANKHHSKDFSKRKDFGIDVDNLSDVKSVSSDITEEENANDDDSGNESEIEFDFHCEMPYYEYCSRNGAGNNEIELNEIESTMRHESTRIVRLSDNDNNNNDFQCHYCALHSGRDHTIPMEKEVTLITQDLAYGGELFSMLRVCGKFEESMARHYFRQLIFALDHLHSRGIYHRDLKPENLVFCGNFELKIVDFGLAITSSEANDGLFYSGTGSIPYTAPEIVLSRINHSQGYLGTPADIWSAGVVLYIMLVGKPPFRRPLDRHYGGQYKRCKHFVKIRDGIFPKEVPYGARELLSNIFKASPKQRWSATNIMNCEWFNGPLPTKTEIESYMMPRCLEAWNSCGFSHMAKLLEEHRANIVAKAAQTKSESQSLTSPHGVFVDEAPNIERNEDSSNNHNLNTSSDDTTAVLLPSPHVVEATPDLYPEIPADANNGLPEHDLNDYNDRDPRDGVMSVSDVDVEDAAQEEEEQDDQDDGVDDDDDDDNVQVIYDETADDEGGNDCDIDDTTTISTVITEVVAPSDVMSGNGNDDYVQQSRIERYLNDSPMMESSSCFQASPQMQCLQLKDSSYASLPRPHSQHSQVSHDTTDNRDMIHVMHRSDAPPAAPPPATFGDDLMVPSRMEAASAAAAAAQRAGMGIMDENVAAANNVDQQSDDSTNEAEQRQEHGSDDNGNANDDDDDSPRRDAVREDSDHNAQDSDYNENQDDDHNDSDGSNGDQSPGNVENNGNDRIRSRQASLNSGNGVLLSQSDNDEEGQAGITAPLPDCFARLHQEAHLPQLAQPEQHAQQQEQNMSNEERNVKPVLDQNGNSRKPNGNDSVEAKNESLAALPAASSSSDQASVKKVKKNDTTVKKKARLPGSGAFASKKSKHKNNNSNTTNSSATSATSNEKFENHRNNRKRISQSAGNSKKTVEKTKTVAMASASVLTKAKQVKNRNNDNRRIRRNRNSVKPQKNDSVDEQENQVPVKMAPVLSVDEESKYNEHVLMVNGSMRKLVESIKTMCMDEVGLYCNVHRNDDNTSIEIRQRQEGRGLHDMHDNLGNVDHVPAAAAASLHDDNIDNHLCTIKFRRSSSQISIGTGTSMTAATAVATATTSAVMNQHDSAFEMERQQSFRVLIKKVSGNGDEFQKIVKSIKYQASHLI